MEATATKPETAPEPAPEPLQAQSNVAAPAPTLVSAFAEMHLNVGDQLHLEPPRSVGRERATTTLLGWLAGASLMVTAPQGAGGRIALQQDETVVLRGFNGRSAFAFKVRVINSAYKPFAYLHLSFPDKVECVAIRSSPRCRVKMPAKITAAGASRQGAILNIGMSGALIESTESLGKAGDTLQIAFTFELHGIPVSLDLRALVRAEKAQQPAGAATARQYGIEFSDLQPNDQLTLGNLVWYTLHEHPRSAI